MKMVVEYSGKRNDPGDEYQARCSITIDGKPCASVGNLSDCPEDANLGRDLRFVYNIPDFIKAAHAAGKIGEPLDIEYLENC